MTAGSRPGRLTINVCSIDISYVQLSFVDTVGGPAAKTYEAAPVFLRFLKGGGAEMRKVHAAWKAGGDGGRRP